MASAPTIDDNGVVDPLPAFGDLADAELSVTSTPIQPEPTLQDAYAAKREQQFDQSTSPAWENPMLMDDDPAPIRDEEKRLNAMLADRENLGGVADDVLAAAQDSYDVQDFKDGVVNWRATAFLLNTPVDQLKDEDYQKYQTMVSAKLGKNVPKTEAEYRQMLADHFNGRATTERAYNELHAQAVVDALEATNYGTDFPMVQDQGRRIANWMAKYPEVSSPGREWLIAKSAGDMYAQTLADLADVRQYAAPAYRTLLDYTQGKAGDEEMGQLANKLRDLTPAQMEKINGYVALAAETQQIDRGDVSQFGKNLAQSLNRGFDWLGTMAGGDINKEVTAENNRAKLDAGADLYVVDDKDAGGGKVGFPYNVNPSGVANQLPKYLQMAVVGDDPKAIQSQADLIAAQGLGEATPRDAAPLNSRKATQEERDAYRKSMDEAVNAFRMARQLRNLASTGVDPIRPIATGFWSGAIERGAYGLAGSVGLIGAVAVNPFLGMAAYSTTEFERIKLENPEMNTQAAGLLSTLEGGLNAAIDQFQISALMGKGMLLGGLLAGMKGGGVFNYAKRVALIQGEQFLQENLQDLIAPVTESIASALRTDMPDKDFMGQLSEYWQTRPEVFFAVLPLALLGGGFVSSSDFRNLQKTMTPERLRGFGFSEETITHITSSENPAQFDERFREATASRSTEDIKRGIALMTGNLENLRATDLDHVLSEERNADGTSTWVLHDFEGKEVGRFSDYNAATEVLRQNVAANLTNEKTTLRDLATWAYKVLKDPTILLDQKPVSVAQELERMKGIGDEAGIVRLMDRLKLANLQDKDFNTLHILGETTIEQVRDGVYRAVIKLHENSSPRDALEEINHGFFKTAMASGKYTIGQYQTWLEQTERATGKVLPRGTEMEVIESLAQVTEDYLTGRIDDTSMPVSFVDYIKKIALVFKEALVRYLKMDEAFKAGSIDTDFKTALEESLGIDPQLRMDRQRTEAAEKLDPSLSLRDTGPDETPGEDAGTEAGTPAEDVPVEEMDPSKHKEEEGWRTIPWNDTDFSIRVLPSVFPVMDDAIFQQILNGSGDGKIRSMYIDRMIAGGDYLGIPLQGGMFFPAIVENLKAGVVWAFNSKSTAMDIYGRAMEHGGYMALVLMVEGNIVGNKTFSLMWFEQLRRNIKASKKILQKAETELAALEEKKKNKSISTTDYKTEKKRLDKLVSRGALSTETALAELNRVRSNKITEMVPVLDADKNKIQEVDPATGTPRFHPNGKPVWTKVEEELTGHRTEWKTLAQAENDIVNMPQGIRAKAYFQRNGESPNGDIMYGSLLTKGNAALGFPDGQQMVADLEVKHLKGVPSQTIIGIIKIDAVPEGQDPVMTADQAGTTEHRSYKYVLKGTPVARLTKYRELRHLNPKIATQMFSQDQEAWDIRQAIAYSVRETKLDADQIAAIVKKMSAQQVRDALSKAKLTTTPRMVAMLGEFPEYLSPVIEYMLEKRQSLLDGNVSPRDVAKAYWMTIASIGADAIDVSTIAEKAQAKGIPFNPDPMFMTTGADGQPQMRPEELAAYWLGTPEGQRALDNVQEGNFDPADFESGLVLRDSYGRNDLRERWRVTGKGKPNSKHTIMVDGEAVKVEVTDKGNWSHTLDEQDTPVQLPEGLTENKRVQTSGAVGETKAKAVNLTNLLEFTRRINEAKGDPTKLEEAVTSAAGIAEGKKGFISHFLGFGEWSTIDAVELNIWLAGVGDTSQATQAQKMIAAIAKKASGGTATRADIFSRIRKAIIGLRKKAKGADTIPMEVAPHILHHWIWDAAKGIQTTHEGLYHAMKNYSVREQDTRFLELAKDPEANKAELQRMVDEAAKAAGGVKLFRTGATITNDDGSVELKKGEGGWHFGTQEQANHVGSERPAKSYYIVSDQSEQRLQDKSNWTDSGLETQGYDSNATHPIVYLNRHEGIKDVVDKDGYPLLPDELDALSDKEFLAIAPDAKDSLLVRDKNTIKSADPVTYDDQGNVIPLSQRFNPETANINYSIREASDPDLARYDGWKSVEVSKQGRAFSPIVRDLLQRRANGENISRETLDRAINQHFPSQLAPVPANATDLPTQDEVNNAVGKKADNAIKKTDIVAGQPVTIRQDVPSWTNHGVGVVTIDTERGKSYAASAAIDNPQFVIDRKTEALSLRIGMGGDKKPHIQIKGTWSEDQSMPTDLEQRTQVGYNPDRHSYYYDRSTGQQITGASKAYQIGNVVFVTDPQYGDGKISDLSYSIREQSAQAEKAITAWHSVVGGEPWQIDVEGSNPDGLYGPPVTKVETDYNDTEMVVEHEQGSPDLFLRRIEAHVPGEGFGTKSIKDLQQVADRFGVNIVTEPAPISVTSERRLTKWYKSLGFVCRNGTCVYTPSKTAYSIREQSEIDRVASAVNAMNRGPEGRLAVYERAKERFMRLLLENKDALDAIKQDEAADPSAAIAMLDQDALDQSANLEVEMVNEIDSALSDNAKAYQDRRDNAPEDQQKQITRDERDRAKLLEKGIRDKFADRSKRVADKANAAKEKLKRESDTKRSKGKAEYSSRVRSEKLMQAVIELDALLSVLPVEVMGKVGGFTTLAKIGTGEKALGKFFAKRVEMVDKQLERYLNAAYDEQLTKIFERAKPKNNQPGEKPKGIGPEIMRLFALLKEAREWNAQRVASHIAALEYEIANNDLSPEDEAYKRQEAALVALVGNWKPTSRGYTDPSTGKTTYVRIDDGADSNRRYAAVNALRDTWANGYRQFLGKQIAFKQAKLIGQDEAIVSTGKTGDLSGRQDRALKDNGLGGKFRRWLYNLVSFDQFLGLNFGDNNFVANRYSDQQRLADNAKEDSIQAKAQGLEDLFVRLAGSRLDGEKLRFQMSQKSMLISRVGHRPLRFSELEGLTATMMWMQADGRRHMMGQYDDNGVLTSAWSYDQDFIDQIEGSLSDEALEVRQFLLDNYEAEYDRINKVYRELNGIDLPKILFYSPLIVAPHQAPQGMVADPVTNMAVSASSIAPGAIRTRSAMAVAEPLFRDALATYVAHFKQMEHYIAYAPMMREMNGVLRSRNVQNAIAEKNGEQAVKVMNLWLDMFNQGGNRDAGSQLALSEDISNWLGRASQVALVGRIGTLLIQSTQLAAGLAEMPHGAYVVRMSKLLTGNLGWGKSLDSAYIQRRMNEMPPIVREMLAGLRSMEPNALKHNVAKIGRLISGADALFTAGTFAIVYDYHYTQALRMGYGEVEADAYASNTAQRATDRLAQPTRLGSKSIYEITRTSEFARISWAFASDARKTLALAAYAVANKSAGEAGRTVGSFMLLATLAAALIRNAWRDARDDDDDEWFDEKNWNGKRLLLALTTEPLQGLPFVGNLVTEGMYAATGQYHQQGTLLSPVRAIRAFQHLPDSLTGNREVEDMLKDLNGILGTMGLFNQDIAAAASLSTIASDAFGLGKNAKKAIEE